MSQPVTRRSWLEERDTPEPADGAGTERELSGCATRREGWAGRASGEGPQRRRAVGRRARERGQTWVLPPGGLQ